LRLSKSPTALIKDNSYQQGARNKFKGNHLKTISGKVVALICQFCGRLAGKTSG